VDYATIEPVRYRSVQPFLVAAGGGGDAIAASMIARQYGPERPVIATWAWDRLLVDPLPGPRGVADFEGLDHPAEHVYIVTPDTRPIAPAGSTLPALAASLDADLVLLDPNLGCRGLVTQIDAAARWAGADHVTAVDVGGDALARPADPGLRSPLADITSVVATATSAFSADLVVLGVGADGELQPDLVQRRLVELQAQRLSEINRAAAESTRKILEWHPSEATALVVMAVLGYRGRVEIRDRGLPVELTDDTATAWQVALSTAQPDESIRDAIRETTTLDRLEDVFEKFYGVNELKYERDKAAQLSKTTVKDRSDASGFLEAASQRGTQWVTRRRLREAIGTLPNDLGDDLLIPTS
jgi:hypothetical protein